MPTLKDCMLSIRELCKAKGHGDKSDDQTLLRKGFYAVIEIGEAYDLIKKNGTKLTEEQANDLGEEIIDAIFYLLDTYGLLYRDGIIKIDPDAMFDYKLDKNMKRKYHYGRPEK